MPQFDFTTFTGQVFWLLICFFVLYFCVSRIIIPRIASILEDRNEQINKNQNSAQELEKKIEDLQTKSDDLRKKSTLSYSKTIEDTMRECSIQRDKALNKAKDDMQKVDADALEKIQDAISKSKSQYTNAAKTIADSLVKKIFGKSSKFDQEIEISINKFKG